MTKEAILEILKKYGVKVDEMADEVVDHIVESVNEWKDEYDPETRRDLRKVWAIVGGIGCVLSFFLGYWVNGWF